MYLSICHLRGEELGHGRLLNHGHARLLHARCVVHDEPRRVHLGRRLRQVRVKVRVRVGIRVRARARVRARVWG